MPIFSWSVVHLAHMWDLMVSWSSSLWKVLGFNCAIHALSIGEEHKEAQGTGELVDGGGLGGSLTVFRLTCLSFPTMIHFRETNQFGINMEHRHKVHQPPSGASKSPKCIRKPASCLQEATICYLSGNRVFTIPRYWDKSAKKSGKIGTSIPNRFEKSRKQSIPGFKEPGISSWKQGWGRPDWVGLLGLVCAETRHHPEDSRDPTSSGDSRDQTSSGDSRSSPGSVCVWPWLPLIGNCFFLKKKKWISVDSYIQYCLCKSRYNFCIWQWLFLHVSVWCHSPAQVVWKLHSWNLSQYCLLRSPVSKYHYRLP